MRAEYRWDSISDRWVIIAPGRAARPDQYGDMPSPRRIVAPCPFCPGQEGQTPPAAATYPPHAARWQVRVVPNLFPAVELNLPQDTATTGPLGHPALGVHEVIIESPEHVTSLTELSDPQLTWSFVAYQERLARLAEFRELAYGQVFKNARAGGGASLEHVHSQLIATAHVPREIQQEVSRCADHWRSHGRCIYCDLVATELREAERLVAVDTEFVVFCPYASRFPYEAWVFPRRHASDYGSASFAEVQGCARVVRELVQRVERCLETPAYNFWIHTAPLADRGSNRFHWHVEFAPRVARLAGFELGAGCFINSVSPEQAAQALRRAL